MARDSFFASDESLATRHISCRRRRLNLMNNLNFSQKQAVLHDGGRLLIVAGPGTGKTYTLIHRIEHLAKNLDNHQKILAITFTNKAAEEMKARLLTTRLSARGHVSVGTFHRFCLKVLREHSEQTKLPENFCVATPEEVDGLIKELWPEIRARERQLLFDEISQWKSNPFEMEAPESVCVFKEALRKKAWLDFDDVLLEAFYLLTDNKDVLTKVKNTYAHIFVDEYQDINAIQQALLKILVGSYGHITAIGDPNQAIYGFRGSDMRFFKSFSEDYSGAVTLSLSENYRSSTNLLAASSQIIAASNALHVPELTAKIYAKGRLTVHAAPTDRAEAEYVVHQIEKLTGGTSMFSQDSGRVDGNEEAVHSFGDFVVLYRLNSQARLLEEAFARSGIPYHISGRKTKEALGEVCPHREEEVLYEVEKVSLMSIHAAKGLEFAVVFIVGCEQDILPLHLGNLRGDEEEERRLFYVGMTRAKQRLYLVRASRRRLYGKRYEFMPSPFLSDIEEGLKEHVKIQKKFKVKKKVDEQIQLFL